jgi:hypothetical protein
VIGAPQLGHFVASPVISTRSPQYLHGTFTTSFSTTVVTLGAANLRPCLSAFAARLFSRQLIRRPVGPEAVVPLGAGATEGEMAAPHLEQ